MSTKEDPISILNNVSEFEKTYKDEIKAKIAAGLTPEQARAVVKEQIRHDAAQAKPTEAVASAKEEKSSKGK